MNHLFQWGTKNSLEIIIAVLLFIVGFQFIYENPDNISTQTNIEPTEKGKFLRFVYIGSSNCGYSNNPETHEMVSKIKKYFKDLAHKRDINYITTGIAKDLFPDVGIQFLKNTGPYDEVTAGASWFNLGLNYYIWDNIQGRPATPQILLTQTNFNISENGSITRSEDVLHRATGIQNIRYLNRLIENTKRQEINKLIEEL